MTKTPGEFLNWYCWYTAETATRFHPPQETAEECLDEFEDVDDYQRGVEYGQHSRAFLEAADFFEDARAQGLNPVERAKRYEEENDIPEGDRVEWAWLEDTHYGATE